MFRIVGDVADSVSSRKLVAPFPNAEGVAEVSKVSFGRFDGEGPGVSS